MPFANWPAINTTPALVSRFAYPFPKVFQLKVNKGTVDDKQFVRLIEVRIRNCAFVSHANPFAERIVVHSETFELCTG